MKGLFAASFLALGVLLLAPNSASAAKTTVTVTNKSGFTLNAIFKAVGCAEVYHTDNSYTMEVCAVKEVANGASVSYEYGGGTSGRKVWAGFSSGTDSMMLSTDATAVDTWHDNFTNRSAIVQQTIGANWGLYDNTGSACNQEFGIIHDGYLTWNEFKVYEHNTDTQTATNVFLAHCSSAVTETPTSEQVQAVPTLSTWMLVLLASLLGGLAFLTLGSPGARQR